LHYHTNSSSSALAGCGKTLSAQQAFNGLDIMGEKPKHSIRMLKKPRLLTRPTLARRDAPCPKQGRSELSLFIRGGWDYPNCARPTRACSSRALREHGDRPSYPTSFFSILLVPFDMPMPIDVSHVCS